MPRRLTDRERLLRAVTEASFQRQVEALLTGYGWRWYHAPDNRPSNGFVQNVRAGFPDIVAVRGDRMIFAELKRETGKVSPAQEEWLAALQAAQAEVYVWRPRDVEEISRILAV